MDAMLSLAFAGFLLPCFLAASTGAFFRPGDWYRNLAKPRWNPPDWLFPPAWTLLYILIGAAGWLAWREAGFAGAGWALAIWLGSLFLNAGWSWLFFGLRRIDWALAEVVLLWLSIAATIAAFAPISTTAAWLLVPYLAWVGFAGALNLALYRLNRERVAERAGSFQF